MTTDSTSVLLVKALYNFKASNNDELCLQKGDVITVTQVLDGGWWEGTLNGVTGWFPSNYVKELKIDSQKTEIKPILPTEVPLPPNLNNIKLYRGIVFQDILDTENIHTSELQSLITNYLNPLKETDILSSVEYSCLVNNIEEVCASCRVLLQMLEDVKSCPPEDQRIGGEFIRISVYMKNIHLKYSSGHPKAAFIIEKHRDVLSKFMDDVGAPPPGLMTLTTGLSKPFRRLEKYPALLLELLRHTQENHVDRGDTQRAAFLFRDIANSCASIRKQKEMELEIMTETIKGWEGEPIQSLGPIIHMGSVIILTDGQKRTSRFLVAFPEYLVILSSKLGHFIYEGKLPLANVIIRRLDPSEGHPYAFEITGSPGLHLLVICSSSENLNQWLNVFPGQNVRASTSTTKMRTSISPVTSVQGMPTAQQSSRSVSPEDKSPNNRIAAAARQVSKKVFPSWNLRPHPPLRASLTTQSEGKMTRTNSRREKDHESDGDLPVRQLMETLNHYDTPKNITPKATSSAPPRLNFDEDKILIDGFDEDGLQFREKTIVDTVYMLKDQIQELKMEVATLTSALQDETQARKKLEDVVRKHFTMEANHVQNDLDG